MLKVNEFLSRKGNAPNCEAWFGLTARGEFNLICDQHALDFMKIGFGHRSPIPLRPDSTTHGLGTPGQLASRWHSTPRRAVSAPRGMLTNGGHFRGFVRVVGNSSLIEACPNHDAQGPAPSLKMDSNFLDVHSRIMVKVSQCMCPRTESIMTPGGVYGFQSQRAKQD